MANVSIGATEPSGNFSLTASTTGLPERISNIVTDDDDKIEFILGGDAG